MAQRNTYREDEELEEQINFRDILRVGKYLKPYMAQVARILVVVISMSCIVVAVPYLTKIMIDEAQDVSGTGGGLNPRTALGQTSDGSIILLAIDGRMANSLGASFSDLQDIMLQYGAVNASVMDGGTSTQMYYDGEVINKPYSPTGPRSCPTAFLIK